MNSDLSIKSYTDLNELNKLKKAGRDDAPKALAAVAEQFESLFLNMLLKNMRQANEGLSEGGLFDSSESKFYQDMMDQQLSVSLSSGQGIGLREVLIRQLSPNAGAPEVDKTQTIQLSPRSDATLNQLLERSAALSKASATVQSVSKQVDSLSLPFESPEQFVQQLLPMARQATADSRIAPEVLVAQAALETGWGKHLPRHSDGGNSHNLFGIKADQRWQGERVTTSTLEFKQGIAQREQATFRAYPSYEQSMQDYLAFLEQSPRYQNALDQADDPRGYTQQLQLAGYATDPAYSSKILGILDGDVLQKALAQADEG